MNHVYSTSHDGELGILDLLLYIFFIESQSTSQTLTQDSLHPILKFNWCLAASTVHEKLKAKFSQP